MSLKELLGEELYNQVIEKAGDNKIAIVSDGNWIPKDKFDAKNQEVKDLQGQIKERDNQLTDLGKKAKDNEELTAEIDRLKEENKVATQELQDKLDKQAFDFSLEKALSGAGAKNPKAVKALLDTESIKLDGETLLGLDEQLKALQESDGYLFGEDEPPGLKGRKPHDSGSNPKPKGITRDEINKMSYKERVQFKQENPEQYEQLIKGD